MKKNLLAFSLLSLSTWLLGQTVTPANSVFQFGDDISISFGGSTAPLDWVGIYNEGETPDPNNGGVGSITWFYINATQDNTNTTVVPSGTLTFSDDLPAGNYIVHMLCCDGYTIMASNTFTVEGGGGPARSELFTNNFPLVGGTVNFSYSNGPGNDTDWIGIYNTGESPDPDNGGVASIVFQYTTGTEGVLVFDIAGTLPAGTYDAHFFCCDIYTILASTTFTVYEVIQPNLAPVALNQTLPLRFAFAGGTGSLVDWVGIYNAGEMPDPGNGGVESLDFSYVPGANGEVAVGPVDEVVEGNFYDAHFFCCDGYEILASHLNWTVVLSSTGEPQLVPALFNVSTPAAEMVRLTFVEPVQGQVSIVNMTGQTMRHIAVNGEGSIDVDALNMGAYVVQLQTNERTQSRKVVVK